MLSEIKMKYNFLQKPHKSAVSLYNISVQSVKYYQVSPFTCINAFALKECFICELSKNFFGGHSRTRWGNSGIALKEYIFDKAIWMFLIMSSRNSCLMIYLPTTDWFHDPEIAHLTATDQVALPFLPPRHGDTSPTWVTWVNQSILDEHHCM